MMKIRIGTRGSRLALWQAEYVSKLIGRDKTELVVLKTMGDKIQNVSFEKMEGKGFFTKEIEDGLIDGRIDLAVHSLKDLPTESMPGLEIAAIPERGDPSDTLLIRREAYNSSWDGTSFLLPVKEGAVVGTSSVRRMAQLKNAMAQIEIKPLRGNVTTRLRKLQDGEFDAIVLASAGIKRLKLDTRGLEIYVLPYSIFLPAPAQGALGLQIRSNDNRILQAVKPLNHHETGLAVRAERAFLHHFGGGCHIPLGALARFENSEISLTGVIAATDGSEAIRESIRGKEPEHSGAELARILKEKGADNLL